MEDKTPSDQEILPTAVEQSDSVEMTAEELDEAKRYGRLELVLFAVGIKPLMSHIWRLPLFLFAEVVDIWLKGFLPLYSYDSLRLMALFLIVTGGHVLVSFPLSLYSGHLLEHRFQLSNQTFAAWLWRYTKRILLGYGIGYGLDARAILVDLDNRFDLVACRGRGIFPGQRDHGTIGSGINTAVVL